MNTPGTINDPTLYDAATGEQVAEMAQLALQVENVDRSIDTTGVAVDSTTEFGKNQHPIVLFEFTYDSTLHTLVPIANPLWNGRWSNGYTYERALPQAYARQDNAGLVRLTADPPGLAMSPNDPTLQAYYSKVDNWINYGDWHPAVDQLNDKIDEIKIPPPYVPPPPAPFLQIIPSSLTWENVSVGKAVQQSFQLINFGDGAGDFELVNNAAAFDFVILGPTKGTLQPKSSITL